MRAIVGYEVGGLSDVLSSWYTQAKITVGSFLSEPEMPFYMQAQEDLAFNNFQIWCNQIKLKMREVKEILDRGGVEPRLFRKAFFDAQEAMKENMISPFYYYQQLTKLKNKIKQDPRLPNVFADIIREAQVRFREQLEADSKTKQHDCFYDDLANYVIQFSGKKIEADELNALLNFYNGIIDASIHQQVNHLVSSFVKDSERYYEKHVNSNTGTIFVSLPNQMMKTLFKKIDVTFDGFEIETSEAQEPEQTQDQKQSRYQQLKTYFRSTFNYARENPKTILNATAAAAALGYLYYFAANTDHENALTTSQFPQWATPSWQITNALTFATITYSLEMMLIENELIVPRVIMAILVSFPQMTASQSISSSISQTIEEKIFSSDQIQVNNYTTGEQRINYPGGWSRHFAEISNHSFLLMWGSVGQDGDNWGIFSQLFNHTGNRINDNFQVNTYFIDQQVHWHAAKLLNGNFVVVWASPQDGSSYGVYGQRFDARGYKISTEFCVNDYINGNQMRPNVGSTPNGNFIVAWQSAGQRSEWDIYAKMFNSTGNALNTEFRVTSFNTYRHGFPGIISLVNNDYRITWVRQNRTTDRSLGGYYRDYNVTGFPLTGELSTANLPIKTTIDGYYLTTRNNATLGKLYGQIHNLIYNQTGNEFLINPRVNTTSYAKSSTEGDSLIVWRNNYNSMGLNLYGSLIDWNGRVISSEFCIDQYLDPYMPGNQLIFKINSLSGGKYVVSWQSYDSGNHGEIFVRVIDPSLVTLSSSSSTSTLTTTTSTSSFFSATRTVQQTSDVTSAPSTSSDKTSNNISSPVEPDANVVLILGIVLGVICGLGTIGVLGIYLLRRNKNTEEVDMGHHIELDSNDFRQEGRTGVYDSVSGLFGGVGSQEGKEKSPYGKVPITVSDTTESPYGMTPSNPEGSEQHYDATPSRVTALP